jgi:hypothetical protein
VLIADHVLAPAPTDRGIRLWRYMEFAKFASLLLRSELWFARPDTLGAPWEASFGQLNMDDADELEREMHRLDPEFAATLSGSRRE